LAHALAACACLQTAKPATQLLLHDALLAFMLMQTGALEMIRVRVLASYGADRSSVTAFRMELSSESNLFFHYEHALTPEAFSRLQVSKIC
jgi:hypothetical protein